MSRFFAVNSDSDSDSSSEEEVVQRPAVAGPSSAFTFSEDEEDVKRVVRSAKEKRYDELDNIIKQIRNSKKIKDMSNLLDNFENLQRAFAKAAPVIAREENGSTPRFFIKCLVEMEDFINETWEDKEFRKHMSKTNSKSFVSLRQKLRKYLKDFDEDLANFRENPDLSEVEEDSPKSGNKSEAEKSVVESKPSLDSDSEASDWPSESDSSSSSSDDEKYNNLRERFLKKNKDDDKKDDRRKDRKERGKEKEMKKVRKLTEDEEGDQGWEKVRYNMGMSGEKLKMFSQDDVVDTKAVMKKLNEIILSRCKKRTHRREKIELLDELLIVADQHMLGIALHVKIQLITISTIFEYNPNISDTMKSEYWSQLLKLIDEVLDLLLANSNITVTDTLYEETESLSQAPYIIKACILTFIERLDDEFTKLLKEIDPHSMEYVNILKDDCKVVSIIDKAIAYLERGNVPAELCRIYLRKIEHVYYKFDPKVLQQRSSANGEETHAINSHDEIESLCKFIYTKDTTDRLRTRAILCHIYHLALHDSWFQAKELCQMSHLQENIQHSDPNTQILYNRAMAQLGLSAFRHGCIKDAHNCLADLMTTGKPKELLAQGLLPQRQHERTEEQEKVEKQRLLPFHMHINLELLECVHLVSAMLIEIPYMAAHEFDVKRRMISKIFYQQLRASERQALIGPPESMREHVVAAAKAMRSGNWKTCINFIFNEKMNVKVWHLFYQPEKVREMLTGLIKQESLRTYLFTYSRVYKSISLDRMSEMFQLEKSIVNTTISKMLINDELMATLEGHTNTLVMLDRELRYLEKLCMQIIDKATNIAESNERILDSRVVYFRSGNASYRDRLGYRNLIRRDQGRD